MKFLIILIALAITSIVWPSVEHTEPNFQIGLNVAKVIEDIAEPVKVPYVKPTLNNFPVDVTYYSGGGMGCTSKKSLVGAYYYPHIDSTTSIFDPDSAAHLKWCAASQDLLWLNDGPIHYGDTIIVTNAGRLSGTYIVKDAMAPYMKESIDILVSNSDYYHEGRWKAKITHLPKK